MIAANALTVRSLLNRAGSMNGVISESQFAGEAFGRLDVAGTRVPRNQGIRAQRSRASGKRRAAGDDSIRRFALLHPAFQRRQGVELVSGFTAAAVIHAWHQVEARERCR